MPPSAARAEPAGQPLALSLQLRSRLLRRRRRPPGPGEPSQCWISRWCPSALWGTSNGSSRSVSVRVLPRGPGPLMARRMPALTSDP